MRTNDLNGRRVLVVEDEAMVVMYIQDALEELGCEVVGPVSSPERALALVAEKGVDAALLDINLGENGNSYPVADLLSRQGVPFVFLTGYGQPGLHESHRNRPVVTKPFTRELLADALSRALSV